MNIERNDMKNRIKIILLLTMTVFISFLGIKAAYAAQYAQISEKNSDFKVNVLWDDSILYYESDKEKSNVEIFNNTGEEFEGKMQLIPAYNKKHIEEYDFWVDKDSKVQIDICLSNIVQSYDDSFYINIVDNEDKVYFSKRYIIKSDSSLMYNVDSIGVLSDSKDSFDHMSRTYASVDKEIYEDEQPEYINNIIYWDSFPEDEKEIMSLRFIIISNYDTSKLSQIQKEMLRKYVSEGGNLVVGTGNTAEKTLSGLDYLIDYDLEGIVSDGFVYDYFYQESRDVEKQCPETLAYTYVEGTLYADSYDGDIISGWDSVWRDYYSDNIASKYYSRYEWAKRIFDSKGKLRDKFTYDADVVMCDVARLKINNSNVTKGIKSGKYDIIKLDNGRIYVFSIDLCDSDIEFNVDEFVGNESSYIGGDSKNIIADDGKININKYIILFIIYMVISTFGLYFILKKINKSHFLFSTVCICAILFSVVVGVVAKNDAGDDSLTYVTVNTYTEDGECYSDTSLTLVNISSGKYEYEIGTGEYIKVISTINEDTELYYEEEGYYNTYTDEYAYGSLYNNIGTVRINETPGYSVRKVEFEDMEPYTVCTLEYKEKLKTGASFQLKQNNGEWYLINGTGKNLKCVAIKSVYGIVFVGNISAGGEIKLSDYTYENVYAKVSMFENEQFDKNMARMIKEHYKDVWNNYLGYGYQVIGIEDTTNTALGEDWRGITLATQQFGTEDDIIPVTNGLKVASQRQILGSWSIMNISDFEMYQYGTGNNDVTVDVAFDKCLILYNVPEGGNVISLGYQSNDVNDFIRSRYKQNGNVGEWKIFNYETNEYDVLNPFTDFWKKTDMKSYYKDDEPIRIMVDLDDVYQYDCFIPIFSLEVE